MTKWLSRGLAALLLALSATALVLGVKLYQQRETLKGRTQKLEAAVRQVASTIEAEDGVPDVKLTLPDDQLKTFTPVPGGPATMDVPLNLLVGGAQRQLARLNTTRTELADTRAELGRTVDTLTRTSNDLVSARETIKQQEAAIEEKNTAIAEKDTQIRGLEKEKGELQATRDEQKQQIEDLEVENRDLIDTNAFLVAKVDELEKMISPDMRREAIPKGKIGLVVYVSPEWNFLLVRLDPTRARYVGPETELLIHRSDRFVGKVRVQTVVEDTLAVAEIVNDWQQHPFGKGDEVIF